MSKRVISTLCIGLIFLGLDVSTSLGMEEYLPQLTEVTDLTDTPENKQNLRLMQVIQQYSSKYNNQNSPADEKSGDDEAGTRKRSVTMTKDGIKTSSVEKRETGEDSIGDFTEYGIGKRGLPLHKNPFDMGFKNRPGFRSWGGKRSKFVTWGGKRLDGGGILRIRKSKFNNWGGKRSLVAYDNLERWDQEKRDTFRSWGGKRPVIVPPTLRAVYDSHSKFSNWGGKRFDEYRTGKRDVEYTMPYEQDGRSDVDGKRGQFQSWGGKRFDNANDGYHGEDMVGINWLLHRYVKSILNLLQNDRRIGKKNILGSAPLEDEYGDFSTSGFSAWGGRR